VAASRGRSNAPGPLVVVRFVDRAAQPHRAFAARVSRQVQELPRLDRASDGDPDGGGRIEASQLAAQRP
jgi:hypothetical protein